MLPEHNTKQMTWDKTRNEFVIEVSLLSRGSMRVDWIGEVSGKRGFNLRSHVTSKVVFCEFVNLEKDGEGDVQAWHFRCDNDGRPFNVVVLND